MSEAEHYFIPLTLALSQPGEGIIEKALFHPHPNLFPAGRRNLRERHLPVYVNVSVVMLVYQERVYSAS
jgi:hypothetical protein